jgi:hypothetical protein
VARAVAAFGAAVFVAEAFGGGALATHTSPSACLPCGHTNGQTRRWIPCTVLIASDDTSSGMLMEVSLMNLRQAALVASSNSPLTSPLKQPTRWSSTCNERVSACVSGGDTTVWPCSVATREAILCSATGRSELSGNCRTNCRSLSGSLLSFTEFHAVWAAKSESSRWLCLVTLSAIGKLLDELS